MLRRLRLLTLHPLPARVGRGADERRRIQRGAVAVDGRGRQEHARHDPPQSGRSRATDAGRGLRLQGHAGGAQLRRTDRPRGHRQLLLLLAGEGGTAAGSHAGPSEGHGQGDAHERHERRAGVLRRGVRRHDRCEFQSARHHCRAAKEPGRPRFGARVQHHAQQRALRQHHRLPAVEGSRAAVHGPRAAAEESRAQASACAELA